MSESTKTIAAVFSVIALALAFWLILLSPKRDQANELSEKVSALTTAVTTEQQRYDEAVVAKKAFPASYRELVVLGKAVPAEAATASLLVQLNGLTTNAKSVFSSIKLNGAGEEAAAVTEGGGASSLLPIGAQATGVGLAVMPYQVTVQGGFFGIAKFLQQLDALVETKNEEVDVHGRLLVVEGFTLEALAEESGSSNGSLLANFRVATYVTPPGEGLTAGATPAGPSTTETTSVTAP
jgi:Tfp pilus assembly protein PilO